MKGADGRFSLDMGGHPAAIDLSELDESMV
jgi:hypothetical protein